MRGCLASTTWKTKWGRATRPPGDPPTIEEALIAAEALDWTTSVSEIEIAASLMGVSNDEVKALAAKQAAMSRGRSTLAYGRNRAVVVEYKRPRTFRSGPPLGAALNAGGGASLRRGPRNSFRPTAFPFRRIGIATAYA